MVPAPVVAVPGVDMLPPGAVPDADVDVPVEAELPLGVITVPDGDITFPEGVTTVPAPVTPVDGRIGDGDTMPEVSGGTVVTGGTATGGTTVIGGAATRGVTTWLLSTQSGPLRSMHAGIAAGTLSLRSSMSAAITGAATVNSAMNEAAIVFMVCPLYWDQQQPGPGEIVHGTLHLLSSSGSRVCTSPSSIVAGDGVTCRDPAEQPAAQTRMTHNTVRRTLMTSP